MKIWECEKNYQKGVIVIVHGYGDHHGRYMWLKDKCLSRGFHVVMDDLPGMGGTTRRAGHIDSFDEYVETVSRWIKESKKYNLPIFVMGHSMGGLATVRALTERELPISGVILSSPCLGLIHTPPDVLRRLIKLMNKWKPAFRVPLKNPFKKGLATRNEKVLKRDEQDPFIVTKVSVRWFKEMDKAMQKAFRHVKEVPDVPLLVLQGGSDKIVKKHDVYKWFRHLSINEKTYKEFKGLYHEVFNEPEREQVFDQAYAFLQSHVD
ncbi:alpha/beta hydrolase [Halobacillus amylolyticus]|uniref:Alpha/beta hydrolase n=1 Tax=Halobacillus amylolyticus TaxID=2932259 RepID=A0ABY4H939_9BACI|nr:alpha/beta hydrolase [Halobacillus amylolyticus]UOR11396.1 alpha/beta hydrolase [Halobacillus amylolyticus]